MNNQVTEPSEFKNQILTKKFIMKAPTNSIDVLNTKEEYEKYFKLGGTVAKMNLRTTKQYSNFMKSRRDAKE
tara:strand:- start:859 stop:1074 length:216 start_codon:yes stop_codon:yes gene_type:complete